MRIGVVYPQTEYPADHIAIRDYAQAAETLGFSHILAYDHILGANPERPGGWRGPYTHKDPFMEPFVTFGYMAAFTEKIEFTTGVLILPQRQTALVAKQASILDVLCNGRLRLGVGIGWNKVEYEALNKSFNNRGRRVEEQVAILKSLWTQPLVSSHQKDHSISDAGLNPMPIQQPIPVWFGGHHENVLRRVAELGEGWMPNYRQAEDAKLPLEKLDKFLDENNRNRKDIGLEFRLQYKMGAQKSWAKSMQDWKALGTTHASINTMRAGLKSAKEHIKAIEEFAKAML
jgi:probable F420-dependent oxidoreductase